MRRLSTLLCAVCTLAISAAPAFAQQPTQPTGGIEAGIGWSHVSPEGTGESISSNPGFIGGGFVLLPVSKAIAIQIEALYAQKHSHHTFSGSSSDLNLDYFELPILVKMPLFKSLFMSEGVAFGFPASAKIKPSS